MKNFLSVLLILAFCLSITNYSVNEAEAQGLPIPKYKPEICSINGNIGVKCTNPTPFDGCVVVVKCKGVGGEQ